MKTRQATHRAKRIWISLAVLAVCVAFVAWRSTSEYRRMASPDGRFYAVAEYRTYWSFIPRFQLGSALDSPGFVTVFTSDGIPCGRTSLPMLQDFAHLQWSADAAEIPFVAQWNLHKRTVHPRE